MQQKKLKIYSQSSLAAAEAATGEILNKLLEENKNIPVLFLVAGGSALQTLDFIGQQAMGENLTVTVTDERFSIEPDINNFLQLQKTEFYVLAQEKNVSFFGTLPRKDDTMESLAHRWEFNLRTWKNQNPQGKIFALLGMGPDGHTAGIFPFINEEKQFKNLFLKEDWTANYNAGQNHKFNLRITTTLTFFKTLDEIILFACGENKKEKITLLLRHQGNVFTFPALGIYLAKNASLVTDQEI